MIKRKLHLQERKDLAWTYTKHNPLPLTVQRAWECIWCQEDFKSWVPWAEELHAKMVELLKAWVSEIEIRSFVDKVCEIPDKILLSVWIKPKKKDEVVSCTYYH